MANSPIKALKQLFLIAPRAHVRQTWRNIKNPSFWKYAFRNHDLVKCKTLFFWQWWSLNRDMNGNECPGWQWWYYELEGWYVPARAGGVMPDSVSGAPEKVILKNYRKFPLIRTAIESLFVHGGQLVSLYPTKHEALNAQQGIGDQAEDEGE